ncbi:hypothetical protein ACT80S_05015 [Ramlibacter sp. MAHUQ-53]|uniref:hypothetical protein n=1 Tax=unclassified Ramlibacter TaxID=2617605 RepID=UPI003637BEA1
MSKRLAQTSPSVAYLRFLSQLSAAKGGDRLPDLVPDEREIIEVLATYWLNQQNITVVGLMRHPALSRSASTVHRRVKGLIEREMIALQTSTADSRVKFVMPTKKALRYLDQLGRCLLASVGASELEAS